MIPAEALARLTARASTLDERLAPDFVPGDPDLTERAETLLNRWAELAAKGDRARLRLSLQWRGIDLDRMLPALGNVSLAPESAPISWALQFTELLKAALLEHRRAVQNFSNDYRAAVMECFVCAAKAELCRKIPTGLSVSEGAIAALEKSLLLRLTRLAGPVLDREYHFYAREDSRAGGAPETRARRFSDRVLQAPLPTLFTEYPVLARLVTLTSTNWVSASLELFRRLSDDRESIFSRFHEGRDAGPLIDIQVGDADLHDGHREVLILIFEDEFRVVYKPRSLALDQAFHSLVDWFHRHGLSPDLRSPLVLCRDGYGWAEFIAHRRAEDGAELESFYQRLGVLACIAYVMGATDLHYGNLIAHRGFPVLIDLETLFHAHPREEALATLGGEPPYGYEGATRSVLQSVLLPLLHRAPGGTFVDLSAAAAEAIEIGQEQSGHWLPVEQALLRQTLQDQAHSLEQGFIAAYRFIEQHRDGLLSEDGPLRAFAGCPIRVVLRDTAIYFQLLRQSIEPAVMRDAANREILLERLHHSIAIADSPPSLVAMITREKIALSNLDVPRFMVVTNTTDLSDSAGIVGTDVMRQTPLQEMCVRIEEMCEADLHVQHENIRYSLGNYFAGRPVSRRGPAMPDSVTDLPDAQELVAAAERIGRELQEEARSCVVAPPRWRGAVFMNAAGRFTVGEPGPSFADGGMGIAYFFASLFRVTGKREWRDAARQLSLSYLAPLASRATYRGHIGGGLSSGLGGWLYAAAHIAAMAESEEICDLSAQVARNLAARAVDEERDMSLGDGLAGTLLGIAAIQRLTYDASVDEALQRGKTRLSASNRLSSPGLLRGHAGVVLVANGIGISSLPASPNVVWPNLYQPDPSRDWAEGFAGQAVAALKVDPADAHVLEFCAHIEVAPAAWDDSFALGTAGQADALAWAADLTGRTALRTLALQRFAAAAERASTGRSRLLGGMLGEGLRMPGLLHGSAGIGHVMLRMASEGYLSALAALELPNGRKI